MLVKQRPTVKLPVLAHPSPTRDIITMSSTARALYPGQADIRPDASFLYTVILAQM